jgi:glycosyltransferase involved in cell wall biosynthesis
MISIIITVFNKEKYILRTLKSLKGLDFSKFEIIIIDDGSTDGSNQLINNFIHDNDLIIKLVKTENRGVSSARNLGISIAKNEYLMFLDGDDTVNTNNLRTVVSILEEQFDIYCFSHTKIGSDGLVANDDQLYNSPKQLNFTGLEMLETIVFNKYSLQLHNSSIIYKRNFILKQEILFSSKILIGEDIEFQWKAFLSAKIVKYLNINVVNYFMNSESLTSHFSMRRFDGFFAIENVLIKINSNKLITKKIQRALQMNDIAFNPTKIKLRFIWKLIGLLKKNNA